MKYIKPQDYSISKIVRENFCSGCGTCLSMCPTNAIRFQLNDKKGIYEPYIDNDKCNHCSICLKVCPSYDIKIEELNLQNPKNSNEPLSLIGNFENCYSGFSKNDEIRYKSSSGGLITQLLIYALESGLIDGALVTRMNKENPLVPEPFIAHTRDEIIEASTSKYCPVPVNVVIQDLMNSEKFKKIAVVGLPCQISGLKKAGKINKALSQKIVLYISFFCSGTPNFNATKFLLANLGIHNKEIENIKYRGDGCPGHLTLRLRDNQVINKPYPDYLSGFIGSFYLERCNLCIEWFSPLADISCGDAWLPEFRTDVLGTSLIISRNEKSEELIKQAASKNLIEIRNIDPKRVCSSQPGFVSKRKNLRIRNKLNKLLGRRVYNKDLSINPSLANYPLFILTTVLRYFASKSYLWLLLKWYTTFIKRYTSTKSKILKPNLR